MFSKWLANTIIKKSKLSEEDVVVASYGLTKMLALVEDMLFTVFLGSILSIVWESIIFQISFISLRLYAGGCHSKTELRCIIHSGFVTVACLMVVKLIPDGYEKLWFITLGISVIIGTIAPVEAKNKPLSKNERIINHYKTIITLITLNVFVIADLIFKWGVFYKATTVAVSGVLMLMLVGIIENHSR